MKILLYRRLRPETSEWNVCIHHSPTRSVQAGIRPELPELTRILSAPGIPIGLTGIDQNSVGIPVDPVGILVNSGRNSGCGQNSGQFRQFRSDSGLYAPSRVRTQFELNNRLVCAHSDSELMRECVPPFMRHALDGRSVVYSTIR
jgi:hypothetical protein